MTDIDNGSGIAGNLLNKIKTVLTDPSSDVMMTAVFFAIIILVLILAAAIAYLIQNYTMDSGIQDQLAVAATENPYNKWIERLIIIISLAAFIGIGGRYIDQPRFCANCHNDGKISKSLASSVHNKVKCLRCHQQPGVTGAVMQKVDYARWATVYALTNEVKPKHASIDNNSCLTCHNEILYKTKTTHAIKVRHKDFINKGARCLDCHNSIAHPGVIKPEQSPSMTSCVSCHNNKTASAKCSVCHAKDVGEKMRLPKRERIKVGVSVKWDFCYRCHENKKCTKCHGVSMPHPPGWVSEVKHARPAFVDISVCWRCHDNPDAPFQPTPLKSCGCHGIVNQFHDPEPVWIKNHGPIALGKKRGNGMNERCYSCHGKKLCDFCHEPGKYKAVQQNTSTNNTMESSSTWGSN